MVDDAASDTAPPIPRVLRLWWLWAILALAAGAVTTAAAQGFPIVDLELAGTVERADQVVRNADAAIIRSAIVWDFLFIVLYVLALTTGALWASAQFVSGVMQRAGVAVAFGAVAAGLFDVVENASMLAFVNGNEGWIALARVMAIPKFLLSLIAILYILGGVTALVVRRLRTGG